MGTETSAQTDPPRADPAPPSPAGDSNTADSAAGAWDAATTNLADIAANLRLYIAAKIDALKISLRRLLLFTILGVLACIALTSLLVTTVVLVCIGIADALADLFHSRWLGDVTAGVLLLACIVSPILVVYGWIAKSSYKKARAKYEPKNQRPE